MKGLYDVARHLVWLTQFGLRCSLQALDRQGRPAKKDGEKTSPISFDRH